MLLRSTIRFPVLFLPCCSLGIQMSTRANAFPFLLLHNLLQMLSRILKLRVICSNLFIKMLWLLWSVNAATKALVMMQLKTYCRALLRLIMIYEMRMWDLNNSATKWLLTEQNMPETLKLATDVRISVIGLVIIALMDLFSKVFYRIQPKILRITKSTLVVLLTTDQQWTASMPTPLR